MSQGWYSVNTLSVTNNSAIVTGTGTQFSTFVHGGFGIEIEGVVYQVESADSATQITLAQPYKGPTKANASYSVFPTKGLEVEAHQDVIELIDTFGPLRNGISALDAQVLAATTKANEAADSAATAATKATESATSASNANTRATAAQASATTASGHATTASNAKTAAETARDLAAGYASDANASKVAAAASATSAANSLTSTNIAKTASETARDASVNAKTASEAARNAAQLAQGAAEDAADEAILKRNEAEGFKNTAGSSATTATTKANEANLSAIAAAASAQEAEDYKDDAETAKNAAIVARSDAETARNTTLNYRNSAEGFKDTAGSHATNAELAALRAENAADTAENFITLGSIEMALGYVPVAPTGATFTGNITAPQYQLTDGGRTYATTTGLYLEASTGNYTLYDKTNAMWRFYVGGNEKLSIRETQIVATVPVFCSATPTTGNHYVNKTYVDNGLATKAGTSLVTTSANGLMSSTDKAKLDGLDGATYAKLSGSTFTGAISGTNASFSGLITAATVPTANDHLANKSYVDGQVATKANLSGASFTGALSGTTATFSGTVTIGSPTATTHAATKGYVDTEISGQVSKTGKNQTLNAGFQTNWQAQTGGALTISSATNNYYYYTNTGAFTINAPSQSGTFLIGILSSTGAGAATFSGFTKVHGSIVAGKNYIVSVARVNTIVTATVTEAS